MMISDEISLRSFFLCYITKAWLNQFHLQLFWRWHFRNSALKAPSWVKVPKNSEKMDLLHISLRAFFRKECIVAVLVPLSKTIGKYKSFLIHKWCSTSRKWLKSKSGGCFNRWHHLHKFTSQFVQISFGSLFWCIGTWPKGKSQRFPFGFRLDPASAKERFSMWHFWSSLGLNDVTSFG